METAEQTLSEMVGCQDFDTTRFFVEEDRAALALANSHAGRDSDTLTLKQKNDRKETEDFYMNVSNKHKILFQSLSSLLTKLMSMCQSALLVQANALH